MIGDNPGVCEACGVYSEKRECDHKIPKRFYLKPESVCRDFCENHRYENERLLDWCRSKKNQWWLCLRCHVGEKNKWDSRILSKLRYGTITCEYAIIAFWENVRIVKEKGVEHANSKPTAKP